MENGKKEMKCTTKQFRMFKLPDQTAEFKQSNGEDGVSDDEVDSFIDDALINFHQVNKLLYHIYLLTY